MNSSGASLTFLSQACIRARRIPLLAALALALFAFGGAHAVTLGWWRYDPAWSFIPAAGALGLVAIWIRRGKRLTVATLARRLDQEWALSSRLESSVELAGKNTALATAQRTDTAARTAGQTPPQTTTWLGSLALLALASLLVVSELAVSTGRWLFEKNLAQQPPTAALAPDAFSASIAWKNPDSEIKATAIEEVPLVAELKASVAPEKITLEISVNGEPRPARVLETADFAQPFTTGSTHALSLSLYLDEVGAQEFDVVAYHLRAEFPQRETPVASPLQFIQIRPPRDDVIEQDSDAAGAGESVSILLQLKTAQLQLVKENFILLHAPVAHTDKTWIEENTRVAENQKTLAQKTFEFHESAISQGAPTLVVDNIGQAFPLMDTASKSIASEANADAVNPQNQALALITATEKIFRKVRPKQPTPASIEDPFKDPQKYKLPERSDTPAGRLEELAKKQSDVAGELDASSTGQASAQQEIARDLKALVDERSLDASAQPAAEQAARDAEEAAQQLAQNDRNAARSPAASAADGLARARAAQEDAGRKIALTELESARREINDAAQPASSDEQSARLAELSRTLRESARAQQQTGSAEAARELTTVSQALAQAAAGKTGENAPALTAARAQAALATRPDLLARAGRQLDRAQVALASSAPGGPVQALAEAELGAQLAEVLLAGDEATDLARQVSGAAGKFRSDPRQHRRTPWPGSIGR